MSSGGRIRRRWRRRPSGSRTTAASSAPIKTQQGGLKAGASATTTINRKDFGLQYNQLIEAGPVVGDEIKVTIDVEANKRAS